jgi:hypothetical protein
VGRPLGGAIFLLFEEERPMPALGRALDALERALGTERFGRLFDEEFDEVRALPCGPGGLRN